jgi:hypothetical protein
VDTNKEAGAAGDSNNRREEDETTEHNWEEDETTANNGTTAAEQHYRKHNNSLKCLIVMSIGLKKSDGSDLFDPSLLPWKSLKKTLINVKSDEMKEEVDRRYEAYLKNNQPTIPKPRTKNWIQVDRKNPEKGLLP